MMSVRGLTVFLGLLILTKIQVVGVKERIDFEDSTRPHKAAAKPIHIPQSSRRRKGGNINSVDS